ncbi:MAG: hypothetical protein K0B81_03610 [Candidatus Cloacimonetes bacterium]|nr:hypothetical protein [Candidatus Cloacimonadota bacterium]
MDEISRNISILLNVEKSFIPKAEYVFRTFGKILGLQPNFYYEYTLEDIHVYYGPPVEDKRPIEIYYNKQAADFFNKQNNFSEEIHFLNYRNENIPFLFSKPGQLFLYTAKSLEIKKDIISSAFFFLSCWEEYTQGKNDICHQNKKKNAPKKQAQQLTIQRTWDFEDIPIVDRYCDIFQKALETMLPGYQRQMKLPHNKDFAASVSHLIAGDDIERNDSSERKKTKKKQSIDLTTQKLISTTRLLNQIKREKNLKSTPEFFLPIELPGNLHEKQLKDINSLISLILSSVSDKTIGIFADKEVTTEQINESYSKYVEQGFIVQGYYQNCWCHHYQPLMKILEETDIKYDISISYCDVLGYRAGISYPYYPYNIKENKPFTILEIPQVINNTLFTSIPRSKRFIKNHIKYLIDDATLYKTHFGIIWNHSQISPLNDLNFDYYLRLLKLVLKRNAWLSSPHDIYYHWMDR